MARREILAGLDIGTSFVRCAICEVDQRGEWNIIGLGCSPSQGIKKGTVVDIESTARCIEEAVDQAQRMAGVDVTSVYVGVSNTHASLIVNRGIVAVSSDDKEITEDDVERVLQAARVINLPSNREILDVIPRQYIIDGYEGIRSPAGMAGIRLEVEALLVTGVMTSVQNLVRCVERAGLVVEALVLNAMALGEMILSPDERELGVVLADIGGGTCELAYYHAGSLQAIGAIALGGDYITGDIAWGLRTSAALAEKIKIEQGTLLNVPEERQFNIQDVGGQESTVPVRHLSSIIEPRINEIFSFVAEELPRMHVPESIPSGLVLVGGVSKTKGLAPYLRAFLSCSVRLAQDGVGGMEDSSYATAIGLVMHAIRRQTVGEQTGSMRRGRRNVGLLARVVGWFKEMWE